MSDNDDFFDELVVKMKLPRKVLDDKNYDFKVASMMEQATIDALRERRRQAARAEVEASDV